MSSLPHTPSYFRFLPSPSFPFVGDQGRPNSDLTYHSEEFPPPPSFFLLLCETRCWGIHHSATKSFQVISQMRLFHRPNRLFDLSLSPLGWSSDSRTCPHQVRKFPNVFFLTVTTRPRAPREEPSRRKPVFEEREDIFFPPLPSKPLFLWRTESGGAFPLEVFLSPPLFSSVFLAELAPYLQAKEPSTKVS